jgi:hypothetical protein
MDDSLALAHAQHFLGLYRVSLQQISRPPLQHELDWGWVASLHKHFLDVGIDRVAYPIKVLLEQLEDDSTICPLYKTGQLTILPESIKVLVYHGQHRVAACQLLERSEEHWWIAEVYGQGDHSHLGALFRDSLHVIQ